MKLKNILIVVEDMEKSLRFYQELFGMEVLTDFGENKILTEGLVLQGRAVWEQLIENPCTKGNADAELYFEENDMDSFLKKLDNWDAEIHFLNTLKEHEWGQRVVRIYDPDGHVIEVGESLEYVAKRYLRKGLTVEETARKTQLPLEYVRTIAGGV